MTITIGGVAREVAVILPCYNEAATIAAVVRSFRDTLPGSAIYVIDNHSGDETAAEARQAGAAILSEPMRGKGHAVRRAFADIDADVYVMADGDGTYDATRAPELVAKLVEDGLDMVVGIRRETGAAAYRQGHRLGNRLFNRVVEWTFGNRFTDIFSGYRVFSRRFVKSFPALSGGFEIETEMSVHAIELNIPSAEVVTDYKERIEGSVSKLNTYRDGLRILWRILLLLKHLRPFVLFGAVALFFLLLGLGLGLPVVFDFLETGRVERFPTAFAAASLVVMALIGLVTAIMLDTLAYAQRENKRLFFLAIPRETTERFP